MRSSRQGDRRADGERAATSQTQGGTFHTGVHDTPSAGRTFGGFLAGDCAGRRCCFDLGQQRVEFTRRRREGQHHRCEAGHAADKAAGNGGQACSQRQECEFERLHDGLSEKFSDKCSRRLHMRGVRAAVLRMDLSAPHRTKHEARNLAVSGPRRALARGQRASMTIRGNPLPDCGAAPHQSHCTATCRSSRPAERASASRWNGVRRWG
jgi:hypothetical protein